MTTANLLFADAQVAQGYARHRDHFDEGFIDRLCSLLPSGLVVDVGAGAGAPAAALAARGREVLAVEPSPAMIHQAGLRNPQVPFAQGLGEEIPLRDGVAGSVLLMYVLHHSFDPVDVLREAARVVRPDGVVVVVSPRPNSERQLMFSDYFPTLAPDMPGADDVADWGAQAGLEVTGLRSWEHRVYPHTHIDDDYIEMVSCELFGALRMLDEVGFARGLARLRSEMGQPLPPSEASVVTLRGTGVPSV